MSLAKFFGPGLFAVSGIFVASAVQADDCNIDTSARNVVDFIVETTPDHWNVTKLASYGADALEDMKGIIADRYDGHVENVFNGLRDDVEDGDTPNWNRVYRGSSYTFYSVIDGLRDGDLTVALLNDAEEKAQELMDAYIAEANTVINSAIELATDGNECLIDPEAPKPAM